MLDRKRQPIDHRDPARGRFSKSFFGQSSLLPNQTAGGSARLRHLVALAPLVLLLLASGYITKACSVRRGSEVEAAAKAIVSSARQTTNRLDKSAVPFTEYRPSARNRRSAISAMVDNKVPVLTFEVGRQGYYTPNAVREYFQQLRSQKFLRYIVLQDSRGALAAICQASPLIESILADGHLNVEAFVENISSGAIVQELAKLDLCEDKTLAVTEGSDRAEALMKMQAARRDWLPVVDHAELRRRC